MPATCPATTPTGCTGWSRSGADAPGAGGVYAGAVMQTAKPAPPPAPRRRRLDPAAAEHLHALMAAWQLVADLSFADLLLFIPVEGTENFRIVGQLRPYTARTLYPADLVGEVVEPGWQPYVERAWREGRRLRTSQ